MKAKEKRALKKFTAEARCRVNMGFQGVSHKRSHQKCQILESIPAYAKLNVL